MTLEQFIRAYDLPSLVPVRRTCEILPCAHSTLYELHNSGRIRIRKLNARSVIAVEDLYAFKNSLPVAGA